MRPPISPIRDLSLSTAYIRHERPLQPLQRAAAKISGKRTTLGDLADLAGRKAQERARYLAE